MACCGDPFKVGDRVEWTVDHGIDDGWFASALGPETAARITHAEEHHSDHQEALPKVGGRVLSITRAWGAYGPLKPDDQMHFPVPGSERFIEVQTSHGVEGLAYTELTFNGWIVELDWGD